MAVGLAGGVKVPLLVRTSIVALGDGYVACVATTYLNQGFNLWKNRIQEEW